MKMNKAMKIFGRTLTLIAAVFALALNCTKPDITDDPNNGKDPDNSEKPVFPEKVVAQMNSGETKTLSFEANMDWEVTVPTSLASWFWIQDESQKVYRLSGKAGKVSVNICLSEREDFDQTPVCEVSLTMGGETKVIAELQRVAQVRSFAVYSCKVDEDGYFMNASEGDFSYEYIDTPAQSLAMLWPEGLTGFSLPVKVESNFEWVLYECPSWAELTHTEGKAGVATELRIVGDRTKYPLDGATENLVFGDASNSSFTVSYPLTIPPCRDYFLVEIASEAHFNAAGQYYNELGDSYVDGGIFGDLTSINGSRVFVVEALENGWKAGSDVSGVTLTLGMWNITSNEVIQSRRISLKMAENQSENARKLYLLALPASAMPAGFVAERDLLNAAGDGLAPDYEKYVCTVISQDGKNVQGGDDKEENISDPSNPNTWDIKFEYPKLVEGAEIKKYVSGPLFDQFKEYGAPVYELRYFYQNGKCGYTPMLKTPSFASVTASDTWITYEGNSASFHVKMDAKQYSRGHILFYNSKGEVIIVLVCTLDI